MKAAVFLDREKPFEIRDYPTPSPARGMAVVELECSGLCGTDLHIWEGAIPFQGPMILGHEFIGRVHSLGEGERLDCLGQTVSAGDLVVVNVIEACGSCLLCKSGGSASCLHLGESLTYTRSPEEPPHLHGGFAEATVAPIRYLHKLPESIPAEVAAAFLCAGPTVIRGVDYAGGISRGEHVVVQGAGPVGLFAALYARIMGAGTVTMIGSASNPLRMELAAALGADMALDIRSTEPVERREKVLAATGGLGADLVIEGTGNPDAIPEGLDLLRLRGRYVWAGQYSDRGLVPIPSHLVTFNALQIFGSAQFTVADRVRYFQVLEEARGYWETIRRVVTDRFTIDQANEAMSRAKSGAAIKTVFVR